MIQITSTKIEGFAPLWKTMRGWSLLFDRPGADAASAQLVRYGHNPDIRFFERLSAAFDPQAQQAMLRDFLLCFLPSDSYHVTVLDGVNDDILPLIALEYRPVFSAYLEGMRRSLALPEPFAYLIGRSDLVQKKDWDIHFEFKELSLWAHSQALTVQLAPADAPSAVRLASLTMARANLNTRLETILQTQLVKKPFTPHITLGYFANLEGLQLAKTHLAEWSDRVKSAVAGETITFDKVSIHGFSNMASFFTAEMLAHL